MVLPSWLNGLLSQTHALKLSFFNHLFIYIYIYIFYTEQHDDPVTQICTHSFFSHYVLHHKWLDRVPSATQRDPIANPYRRQLSASIYPKFPVLPLLPLPPLATTSLFTIFSSVQRFICALYWIPDISDIVWYLSYSFWLTSLRMRISSSIHVAANGIILFFLWLSSIPLCVYIPHLPNPITCQWTFGLILCLGCYE